MIAVKALLGVIIGAVIGTLLFVVAGYPLLVAAAGGRDMNGGIAMGMVTHIGPMGAFLGAVCGLGFALAQSRPSTRQPMSEEARKRRSLKIFAVLVGLVAGYFVLLLYLQGPPRISMQTEPDLYFEFRTSTESLVQSDTFTPRAELFGHYNNRVVPIPTQIRIEGGEAFLSGSIQVEKGKGYDDLRLRAVLAPNLIVDTTVPLYPGAEVLPGLTEWQAVDYIQNPVTGESELGYSQKTHLYRYEVLPHE